MKPAALIAIMGGTGCGKSTFINTIVGKDVTDVGHGLESQTAEVKEYEFLIPNGIPVTLADTPGFNDYNESGGKSDLVILREIGGYLKAKYDKKRKFSGILYLHNIADPKVGGSSQRNIAMFKKLCGPDPLKNVVVVTTFWDEVNMTQGVKNEAELKTKDKFFKELVDGKCRFARFGKYSPEKSPKGPEFPPPISIVSDLLALNPVFVEMQRELAEGKTVEKTSAGVVLYKELQELNRQQEKDISDLNQKIAELKSINTSDKVAREALEDECIALKAQLEELVTKQRNLDQEVHSDGSELVSAIPPPRREREVLAKQRELDLDNIRHIELQHELELLKTQHAKEILQSQLQIRSLLDGNSHDAYQRSQLERLCEDLTATVSDLSQSLIKLRETKEQDVLARTAELAQECAQLRATVTTHSKTLAHLELQLKLSQEAQEKMASELSGKSDNHTSSSTPSPDGKGGADPASKDEKSTKNTGPDYVYYRLYTRLGAFESNHPLYKNDRFIGRIPTKSFSPPHTVASIKLSLCRLEGLSEPDKALLFTPLSSPAPKADSARLSLEGPSGPGLSEQDPIALVVESEMRTEEVAAQLEKLPKRSDDTKVHYVYYRVYLLGGKGDEKAKTSFDKSDISLGRINTLFITPPHTAGSLKACIAKVEGLRVTQGHALYKDKDILMSDTDVITFQDKTYPGSDEGNPVALATDSKFTKRAQLTSTYNYKVLFSPTWLSTNKDEIVHTDGVIVTDVVGRQSYPGYLVINSKGEKGFVHKAKITLIDR